MATIAHKQIDIAFLTEIGLYWKKVQNNDQWHERVREAFRSTRSSLGYNDTEPEITSTVQFGGVCVMAVDDIAHRVIDQGTDPTGLGRWAWLRLAGRQGHHLRVISAYRPVDNGNHGSVHAQQQRHFTRNLRDTIPRQAFYDDLFDEITKWKTLGDHIIIGLDANEDVHTGMTHETFRSLGMTEIILKLHGHRSLPATCDKNHKREPIDGIFATSGIRLVAGGYSPFNSGCASDHRYLWVDISYVDAFGFAAPPHVSPSPRRLLTKDPLMVHRYNQRVTQALNNEDLPEAAKSLSHQATQHGWNDTLEREYNRINERQYKIRIVTEKKIRHLRTGSIPWSPTLQRCRDDIQIWSMLRKKRANVNQKVSNRKLRRLLLRSTFTDAYQKTLPQIEDELTNAFQRYKEQEHKRWYCETNSSMDLRPQEQKPKEQKKKQN